MAPGRAGAPVRRAAAPADPLSVSVRRGTAGPRLDAARIRRAARAAFTAARRGRRGSVAILLGSDRALQRLNREFRGVDRPTDVLSFPDGSPEPRGGRRLGDLAISLPAAARQAEAAGWTLAEVVDRLVVHGVLHLVGFDHESDGGEMMALQGRVLRGLRRGEAR